MALDIGLTNDDGYDAPGITTLYDALVAAGHNVTIVAPEANQSAQGSSLGGIEALTAPVDITEYEPGKYFVDGRPAVATLTALDYLFADDRPDLVISGTNRGDNAGASENISGTVNAAVAAIHEGVPAIAVSAASDEGDYTTGFANAARYTVDVVAQLEAARADGAPLLPDGSGLSINVPGVEPDGVALTTIDRESNGNYPISEVEPGVYGSTFVPAEGSSGNAISEGAQLIEDRITVSALDGDWTSSEADRATLEARLGDALAEPTPTGAKLDIMLVNDDGVDAPGIDALRRALQEAGHDVTIVAPTTEQSGVGTSLTLGTYAVTEFEGGYAVDATPSTTVYTGLDALLTGEDRPDLVVSGANAGANIGLEATASGTLSAAVASVFNYDVPAIAVSAGTDSEGEVPAGLYDTSGDFLVELIDDLIATEPANGVLLPEGLGLNVNLPTDASLDDYAFTVLDEATPYGFSIGERPDGTVGFVLGEPVTSDDPNSEGGNFADGRITITPIDGNYAADLPTTLRVGDALDLTFGLPGAGGDDGATPGGPPDTNAPEEDTTASAGLAALGIDTLAEAVPAAG